VESPRHYPSNALVDVRRAVAWVPPVAGYGTLGLPVRGGKAARAVVPHPVTVTARSLDNGRLRLTVDAHGAVRLTSTDPARELPRLIGIEDVADGGDLYTPAPRGSSAPGTCVRCRATHRGPLRGAIETFWRVEVPSLPGRRRAGRRRGRIDVRVTFALDADAPFLRVFVSGVNASHDHRLRIRFATGIASPRVFADAAFGPVDRTPPASPLPESPAERRLPGAPLHRHVTCANESSGVTVVSDGLAEYEAMPDGTVAVTLVRAVGQLSRADLPERPGHAGWPAPVPQAQCIGPFAGSFAVYPHGPRTDGTIAEIERVVDDVLLPLGGGTLRSALAVPEPTLGVELSGDGLAFAALTASGDGAWMVARCVNLLDRAVRGAWRFASPVRDARLARLDETPLSVLDVREGVVAFTAPSRGVVTVLVKT
jgi:alpha-mannosidase